MIWQLALIAPLTAVVYAVYLWMITKYLKMKREGEREIVFESDL